MTIRTAKKTSKQPVRGQTHRNSSARSPSRDVHGWVTSEMPFLLAEEESLLTQHANWAGPSKLVGDDGSCRRVVQLFLPGTEWLGVDDDSAHQVEDQIDKFIHTVLSIGPRSLIEGWEPPGPQSLTRWLEDAGYPATVDKQGNLRMSLLSHSRSGQVQIQCGPGKLRLEMSLGSWRKLDVVSEKAMHHLASEANERMRLVRIAWRKDEQQLRCDAQVDLSGVPIELGGILPGMLPVAIQALQLSLNQLGLELDTLASAKDSRLAEELLATVENVGPLTPKKKSK